MQYSYLFLTAGLAASAVALPTELSKRQFGFGGSSTSNELDGSCRPVTFIFARGSTEPGNMGSTVGPATCSALKDEYGSDSVACQGVGGAYSADLGSNALPDGTTRGAISEAQDLFTQAASNCPDTVITAGGYSQGAAVMVGSISGLDASVQSRIHGVVLYGNTRNAQENGKIPNFSPDEVLTICATGDGVCTGGLVVTAAHLGYNSDVPDATEFIASRVEAAGGPGSGGSGTSTGSTGGSSAAPSSSAGDSGSGLGGLGSGSSSGGFFDFFNRNRESSSN